MHLQEKILQRPMFSPGFAPLSFYEKLPLLNLPEIYVLTAAPLEPKFGADKLNIGNPFNMEPWKREAIEKRMAELDQSYEKGAIQGYREFMQALNPDSDPLSLRQDPITTKYQKLEYLLLHLPDALRRELWKGSSTVYTDIEGIIHYMKNRNKKGKMFPVGVRARMERLQNETIDMQAVSYIDVIAGTKRDAPAFSAYRRKTALRRWEKVVQLLFYHYNVHERNTAKGTNHWVPDADATSQILARSMPLDFMGFSAIYLGRRNFLDTLLMHDPMTPVINRMIDEPLPSFGIYRPPKNDYAEEDAKLRRVQIIYADKDLNAFEASINDLASLIAIQERGPQAHEKKVEEAKKHRHGVAFTHEQNFVLENLRHAFVNNPIVPAHRRQ